MPLRSTRDEVERLLGAPEGECRCAYRAGDDLVRVDCEVSTAITER